jgi:hypothetical protein
MDFVNRIVLPCSSLLGPSHSLHVPVEARLKMDLEQFPQGGVIRQVISRLIFLPLFLVPRARLTLLICLRLSRSWMWIFGWVGRRQ